MGNRKPWTYTNWGLLEPNDGSTTNYIENGREDYLHFWAYRSLKDSTWNDAGSANVMRGYVVEYTSRPIPESPTTFSEDFSGMAPPSTFENSSGVPADFSNADARFPSESTSGSGRSYLRTVATDYNTVDFVAEVTVSIAEGWPSLPPTWGNQGFHNAFFGLGQGEPAPGHYYEPLVLPVVDLSMHADTFGGDFTWYDNLQHDPDWIPIGGTGTHRVRLTWDAATQQATFAIDEDYTGGPFVADAILDPINGSDNGFDNTNSRIFFGGAGDATFDDFSVSVGSVIPKLFALTSGAIGNWNAPATWNDGSLVPTEHCEATVSQHAVTVATDGIAQSLVIDEGGKVVVGDSANLTIAGDLNINDSAIEITNTGTLNVGGDLRMKPDSTYIRRFDTGTNGMAAVSGIAYLGGSLILRAISSLETVGNSVRPLIAADGIVGTFANEPAIGEHLGYGVFHQGVWYNFSAGEVREEVLQAAPGDVDGNGEVDNSDMMMILAANSFNDGTGSELTPWAVGRAGEGFFFNSAPLEGDYSAYNGFDGQAGLQYELFQDVTIPADTLTATLTTNHRIVRTGSGEEGRTLEIAVRDTAGNPLQTLYHQSIALELEPETDSGWNTQVFDLSAYVGQAVRVHFLELIPESYTGPAMIEFDDIRLEAVAAAPSELLVNGGFETGDFTGWTVASNGGFDWTKGDFNSDGLVNNNDLQLILATGLFGAGPYAAVAQGQLGGGLAVVPEPSTLALLACGLVGLLRWRRRRAT